MRRLLGLLAGALVCASVALADPPPVLTVPVGYTLTFRWVAVADYNNGVALPGLPFYKLYQVAGGNANLLAWSLKGATSMTRKVTQAGTYCFALSDEVWDPNGDESARTAPLCVQVVPNPTAGCQPGS